MEITWEKILLICSGTAALWGFFKNLNDIKKKLNEPQEQQNEEIRKNREAIATLVEKIDIIANSVVTINNDHKELLDKLNLVGISDQALLRDKIHNYYFKNCTAKGYITPEEFEIVHELYEAYASLKGNGIIKKEMEIIEKLPVHAKQD